MDTLEENCLDGKKDIVTGENPDDLYHIRKIDLTNFEKEYILNRVYWEKVFAPQTKEEKKRDEFEMLSTILKTLYQFSVDNDHYKASPTHYRLRLNELCGHVSSMYEKRGVVLSKVENIRDILERFDASTILDRIALVQAQVNAEIDQINDIKLIEKMLHMLSSRSLLDDFDSIKYELRSILFKFERQQDAEVSIYGWMVHAIDNVNAGTMTFNDMMNQFSSKCWKSLKTPS